MNIEEERIAFLIAAMPLLGNAYYPADTGFSHGAFYDPNMQRLFTVWLKAKEHAVEMAKPVCRIETDAYGSWCVFDDSTPWAKKAATSEDAAVAWALTNGYRVIE